MVETRGVSRFGDVHPKVDAVHHHLQYGGDNPAAARATGYQPGFALFHHDGGRHGRQRAFLRPYRVRIAADQPVDVRHARLGREVIHLVIQQNAAVTRHNPGAEGRVERIGHRHRVTVFIHHREVGGLVAFIRRQLAGADLARRLSLVDVDLIGNGFGVRLVGQRLPRHLHEVRVAEIFRAVGVGAFFRFRHHLHGIRAAEAELVHIEVFKNVEDLHNVNAPGRRRRHGEDLVPAVGAANRLALYRLVVRQIRFGDESAVLLHLLCNLVGNRPFVEGIRTVLRNQLQAFSEVLLHQLITLLQRFTVFPEDGLAVFVIRNHFAAVGFEVVCQRVIHHKALPRQLDSRLYHLIQRHRAVFFQRQREARNGTRRAGREMRGQGFFTVRVSLVIKEHVP